MYLYYRFLSLIILIIFSTIVSAEVYKWVDNTGRIHFSDQPPLHENSENIVIDEVATYAATPSVKRDAEMYVEDINSSKKVKKHRRKKVVMYSAAWCGVCTTARNYFNKNKIPYNEYDIDKTKKGKSDYKKLNAKGIPVIFVGKKRLNGFNISKFKSVYGS